MRGAAVRRARRRRPPVGGWVPKRDISRLASLLPGLPPTQGLPGLLGTKVIAGSDAPVPIGGKKAIPPSPEAPLLFLDRETHSGDFSSCLARSGGLSPRRYGCRRRRIGCWECKRYTS
jgi:hypothetical protein